MRLASACGGTERWSGSAELYGTGAGMRLSYDALAGVIKGNNRNCGEH